MPGVIVIISLIFIVIFLRNFTKSENNKNETGLISTIEIRVIDGDTIGYNSEIIRLHGIDAPEIGQQCIENDKSIDCGTISKIFLDSIIDGREIDLIPKGKDKWGRIIGVCFIDGNDISEYMVKNGWAISYREFSSDYIEEEIHAHSNNLGIWSTKFSNPSEWRKNKRNRK